MNHLDLINLVITMATMARDVDGLVSTSTWESLLGNSITVDAHALAAWSTGHCSLTCKYRTGCRNFCYDPTPKLCYVDDVQTSTIVVSASSLRCYKCILRGGCPLGKDYILHNGNCIKLYKSGLNYTAAGGRCALDGGHLYHYKSVDNSPTYTSLLSSVYLQRVWVGADAINNGGEFRFTDGSPLPRGSPLWDTDQPDSFGGSQNCVSHWSSNKLNDNNCFEVLPFMCQIDG